MMARSPVVEIRKHSTAQDEGAFALMVLAAATPRWAPALTFWRSPPSSCHGPSRTHRLALHDAYEFYGEGQRATGLRFPGDNRPDYWDFIYFSFVIGITLQVSDVAVTNRWIRHSVSAHGVLSFFFNTAIFALTVNMAASMI
jgi:hypothetical protein